MSVRSLDTILREADACTEFEPLHTLWKEIVATKYERSLVDLQFAEEHLVELAKKMGARHGAETRAMVEPFLNAIGIRFKKP